MHRAAKRLITEALEFMHGTASDRRIAEDRLRAVLQMLKEATP